MTRKQRLKIEFSFYELSLLSFLKESHPDKADDIAFIKSRAASAADMYAEAFESNNTIPECCETAMQALFEGLLFSKLDMLRFVLEEEFWKEVNPLDNRAAAIRLLPHCEQTFDKYQFNDDFTFSSEYFDLYTELTGTLQLKLEKDGSL